MNSKGTIDYDNPTPSTSKYTGEPRKRKKNNQPIIFRERRDLRNPPSTTSKFTSEPGKMKRNRQPSISKSTCTETTELRNTQPSTSEVVTVKERRNTRVNTSKFTSCGATEQENPQSSTSHFTTCQTKEQYNPQPTTSKLICGGNKKRENQSTTMSTSSETTEQGNSQPSTATFTYSGEKNNQPSSAPSTACRTTTEEEEQNPQPRMSVNETTVEECIQPRTSQTLVPGSLCWGKLDGYPWWPAMLIDGKELGCPDSGTDKIWVYWFGENKISKVKVGKVCPFAESFKSKWTKKGNKTYKKAVVECCEMQANAMFHIIDQWDEQKCLKWAVEGFQQRDLQGERSCAGLKGVPPSVKEVIDEINERERQTHTKRSRKSTIRSKFGASTHSLYEGSGIRSKFGTSTRSLYEGSGIRSKFGSSTRSLYEGSGIRSKFGASSNSIHEMTRTCLVGLERCDALISRRAVTILSFNDKLSSVLLPKLNLTTLNHVIINPDVDALPEKATLLKFGRIDVFIGGASYRDQQVDSVYRHLFECYRIVTVLHEGNSELQWIFHAPLDIPQLFNETANRFFACNGELLKTRITHEQYLLWSNMSSLKRLTTEVRL